jgi:hypothetical protein
MAKRFYDTGLIDQSWYQNLPPKGKALYMHLLCICDYSGVFEVNTALMSMYIGERITEDDIFGLFGKRVIPLMKHDSKGLLTDFVWFQQGGTLRPNSRSQKGVISALKQNDISFDELQQYCTHKLTIEYNPSKSNSGEEIENSGEEIENESKEQETKENNNNLKETRKIEKAEKSYIESLFNKFWTEYPRRDAKQCALKKFVTLMKECKSQENMDALFNKMLKAVDKAKASPQWSKDNGQYIPMAQTWLNQHRWEDEGVVASQTESQNRADRLASHFSKALTF